MSGVRNLRAMFENSSASTSPPDRGRSPGEATGNDASPRPLSKIRTSFVTVEKSGQLGNQLGLKRDTSGEPSIAKRRTSFSIDEKEAPKITTGGKQNIASEPDSRKSGAVAEPIPEVAVDSEQVAKKSEQLGGKERGREPARSKAEEKKVAEPVTEAPRGLNGAPKPELEATKQPETAPTSRTTSKPAPISTAKSAIPSKTSPKKTKTPVPTTPTTPKTKTVQPTEKRPEKTTRASLAPKSDPNPAKPVTAPAHGSVPKTRIGASPPQTGFVKPKPRSPTRPVKLPASLTAHTASSGSKTATAQPPTSRQSISRASGHSQPADSHQTTSRSPSRVSTTPKSTLTRKPSSLNKTTTSRPSLGPPPAQLKRQPSRQSLPAPADETFLARMMRSTASSASKTAEKVPLTPPKRTQPAKKPIVKQEPIKKGQPAQAKKEIAKDGPSKSTASGAERSTVKPAALAETSVAKDSEVKEPPNPEIESDVVVREPAIEARDSAPSSENKNAISNPEPEVKVTEAHEDKELGDRDSISKDPEVTKPTEPEAPGNAVEAETETPVETPEVEVPRDSGELKETTAETGDVDADNSKQSEETTEVFAPPSSADKPEDKTSISATPGKQLPADPAAETHAAPAIPALAADEDDASPATNAKADSPAVAEDPEDVKAREEIVKLNAELLKGGAEGSEPVAGGAAAPKKAIENDDDVD